MMKNIFIFLKKVGLAILLLSSVFTSCTKKNKYKDKFLKNEKKIKEREKKNKTTLLESQENSENVNLSSEEINYKQDILEETNQEINKPEEQTENIEFEDKKDIESVEKYENLKKNIIEPDQPNDYQVNKNFSNETPTEILEEPIFDQSENPNIENESEIVDYENVIDESNVFPSENHEVESENKDEILLDEPTQDLKELNYEKTSQKLEKKKKKEKKSKKKKLKKNNIENIIENQNIEEDLETENENPLKYTIDYESDSMTFDIDKFIAKMKGNAKVEYGPNKLDAHKVSINWKKNILKAEAKKSVDGTIKLADKFLLLINKQEYFAEFLKLSFDSQRAILKNLFTKKEDLFIRSSKLKKDYEDVFYAERVSITTCNLAKPHYEIAANIVKITDQDRVVADSLQLDFGGKKTLWAFLGLFYVPNKTRGIIPPSYGGSSENGLHIKKFGYYWKFNDIIDLAITADAYSSGSLGFNIESFYKKRYEFEGNVNFKFSKTVNGDSSFNTWKLLWKHSSTQNAEINLYADIDLESKNYNKYTMNKEISLSNKQSIIRYRNELDFIPLYYLGIKLALNENLKKKENKMILPEIIFSTKSIYPFKTYKNRSDWYTDLNLRHSLVFKNMITYKRDVMEIWESEIFSLSRYGIKNSIPISINLPIWYFNLNPFFEYREIWYWQYLDPDNGSIKKNFNRIWDYETGVELTTNLYGTFNFFKNKNIEAIRHQITPSLRLVYNPGRGKDFVKKDNEEYEPFENFPFEIPEKKPSLKLYTSINNIIFFKLRELNQEDGKNLKIPMLEKLEIKISYDFLEKNFPWGDIELFGKTEVINKCVYIEFSQKYDPYSYEKDGKYFIRRKSLAFLKENSLGHLKEGKISISTKFQGASSDSENPMMAMFKQIQKKQAYANPSESMKEYVDFSIPWSLELKYNYLYKSPVPNIFNKSKIVSLKLELALSEFWKVGLESGYDFSRESIVKKITKITLFRDLHCWQMKFSWVPLAKNQYFDFSIGVKAKVLDSFKHERDNVSYKNV